MTGHKIIEQIDRLLDIGIALSNGEKTDTLLRKILQAAKSIAAADGGTLYRIENNFIYIALIQSDSLNLDWDADSGEQADFPKIPLYRHDGSLNLGNVVSYVYHHKNSVNIGDIYDKQNGFDFSGPKHFDLKYRYRTQSLLTIPLKNHKSDVIGILQLINALQPETGKIIGFDPVTQKITAAMASQAATLLTQQQLINELEQLFRSMVKLIPCAIDRKSPYTAAHSRRVPIIAMMLAEALNEIQHGNFDDFTLSEADRYELEVATWLHDCGKIATPEHILDKSRKLQTIFDRIALIETRFEILKRDKQIELLKKKLDFLERGIPWDQQADRQVEQTIAELGIELDFIKQANSGAQRLSIEAQRRIQAFSRHGWMLGKQVLPLLFEDEVYNLCVSHGTINAEELQTIKKHIVSTIEMLGTIEFPKHLKNVPEIAGGHHERMDGQGYPRGLRREQMSVQARILALADVFEALMCTGRPYKQGKKLSEALAILENMKDSGHIDPDLYEVFMEKKIYKKYADLYSLAEQIDVD